MAMALIVVGGIFYLIAFVTGIMIALQMIKHDQQGLGIATIILMFCTGIGLIIALVFGWMKANEWGIKNLVMLYTVSLVLGIVLGSAGYAMYVATAVNQMQQQNGFSDEFEGFELEPNP